MQLCYNMNDLDKTKKLNGAALMYQFKPINNNKIKVCGLAPTHKNDVVFGDKPITVMLCGDSSSPYGGTISPSKKHKLYSTIESHKRQFSNRTLIEFLAHTQKQFNHYLKRTGLKFSNMAFDKYSGGVVYIYEVQ